MAGTWRALGTTNLPATYSETYAEGPAPPIDYAIKRSGEIFKYRVQMPGRPAQEFPLEAIVGGERHGLSFLFRLPAVDGLPLPVSRLLESRYFHSAGQDRLALSLGFPEQKPSSYETAFGRVLTPVLEKRCLSCHVQPRRIGGRVETGVSCENCHGPGQSHLVAIGNHTPDHGILNPGKLPIANRMLPCSQCHAGSSYLADPMPDDVLISDQVTALKNSECWRQTAGQITCTNCHNPHQDAPRPVLVARAERTCKVCHSASTTKHAGVCPVNRVAGCVTCHMADEKRGAFTIAEHWIRVPLDQKPKLARNTTGRTTIIPRHLFLRLMVFNDREKALDIQRQLSKGSLFFDLARANSSDSATASEGGYLGDLETTQLDPAWSSAVMKLEPGEISPIVEANGKYFIVQRMPRNFRQQAEAVFNKAMDLRNQRRLQDSASELLEALKIYPRLLRALTHLGVVYGEAGNAQTGAAILEIATRLYPRDAGAHFNLGIAYGALGNPNEIVEYQRTIDIDPDYVPAYLNWGGALYGKSEFDEATKIYREGINVNPLVASLHYSLGLTLQAENKMAEAATELAIARTIDPEVGSR
jgi:tetratricopeptide (TPR) repeat protein